LFRNYYRNQFPSLWKSFDGLVDKGGLVSTREVFREIMDGPITELREWADSYKALFATPTAGEGAFVAKIYAVPGPSGVSSSWGKTSVIDVE
jgi:Domain of unknown function (DUF4411)